MRELLLDELTVEPHQLSQRDVPVPNSNVASFAEKALDQLDRGALAQVIRSRFKAQTHDADLLASCCQYCVHGAIQVRLVTRENRPHKWQFQIQLFCAIGESTK